MSLQITILLQYRWNFLISGASFHCIKAPELRLALICPKLSFSRKGREQTKNTRDITAFTWCETDYDIVRETIKTIKVVKLRYCAFHKYNYCASI